MTSLAAVTCLLSQVPKQRLHMIDCSTTQNMHETYRCLTGRGASLVDEAEADRALTFVLVR